MAFVIILLIIIVIILLFGREGFWEMLGRLIAVGGILLLIGIGLIIVFVFLLAIN